MSAQWSAGPRVSAADAADWVTRVAQASAVRDDAAYAGVRWQWTRLALAGFEARTELSALARAAARRRPGRRP